MRLSKGLEFLIETQKLKSEPEHQSSEKGEPAKEALIKETQAFAKELIDAWGSLGGMLDDYPSHIGRIMQRGTQKSLPNGMKWKESHLAQTLIDSRVSRVIKQGESKVGVFSLRRKKVKARDDD